MMKTSTRTTIKTYSELIQLSTFDERLSYLRLSAQVGVDTFGFDRYINQQFYRSKEWQSARNRVIIRDNGCDLGILDRLIPVRIYVHHMNPISVADISDATDYLLNPEYLICCSHDTHNAIHYGIALPEQKLPMERSPFDTCPWRK